MIIKLYKNISDDNVINKTLQSEITLADASIRGEVDILEPKIRIVSENNLALYNYCYLPDYQRYYFITYPTEVRTNVYDLEMKVDVLETYKAQILQLEGVIGRQENIYNLYLNDDKWCVYADRQVLTRLFPSGFSETGYYYLTMLGGNS